MRPVLASGTVFILALAGNAATVAQDDSPHASAVASAAPSASPAQAGTPSRLRKADVPRTGPGMAVNDVIEGGPGYIAVGGGTPTGLDHEAFIWVSDDGMGWQSVPLFGAAAVGTIQAVAALPDGGYVAVGTDFVPQTERAELVHLLTWFSEDGIVWTRAAADPSFPGSAAWGATSTPDGVAVSGCQAGFHCDVGRVWTTADGQTWRLQDGIAMAPYHIASTTMGDLLVGGEDDAYDLVNGRAAVASSTDDWTVSIVADPDSQVGGLTDYRDGFAITTTLVERGGPIIGSTVATSVDGTEWDVREPKRLADGAVAGGIDAAGDLLVVVGSRYDPEEDATEPIALWTRDLSTFAAIDYPRRLDRSTFGVGGVRLSEDGKMAFVLGTEQNRPAIWYSRIE